MTPVTNPALVPHQDTGRGGKRPDDDTTAHMARYRPGAQRADGFRLPASEEAPDGDDVEAHGFMYPDAVLADDSEDSDTPGKRNPGRPVVANTRHP
jgi:hypothetical protein